MKFNNRIVAAILVGVVSFSTCFSGSHVNAASTNGVSIDSEFVENSEENASDNASSDNEEQATDDTTGNNASEGTDNEGQASDGAAQNAGSDAENSASQSTSDANSTSDSADTDKTEVDNSETNTSETDNKVSDDTEAKDTEGDGADAEDSEAKESEEALDKEETSTEAEKKAPLKSEAFHYEADADGYHFTLTAGENVVPDGTTAKIELLDNDSDAIDRIKETTDKLVVSADVFDIRLFDEEGTEIQPQEGSVHISLKLSDEAIIKQSELEGDTELKLIHIHDEEPKELSSEATREDSDLEMPREAEVEKYVSEDMIDPETQQLKDGADFQTKILESSETEGYYQDITLDFDTDSFSEFAVVNALRYSFDDRTTVSGNETVINLTGMTSELTADFRNVLEDALKTAWAVTKTDQTKFYRIIIPAGTYYKKADTNPLHIGSNTTIQMDNVTIINQKDGRMLVAPKLNDAEAQGKYDDYKNIKLIGGCWDGAGVSATSSLIKLAHLTGLELNNVTLQGGASPHMLELAACKSVKVTGCTFKDTMHGSNELEAFQIDVMKEGSFTYDQDPVYDDYPCSDVEVSGCTFSNLYRGFGSHGALVGPFYYSNVNVHDCTFTNIINTAVMCTMWKDSKVTGNVLTNVGRGIDTTTYTWYTGYPTEDESENVNSLSYVSNTEFSGNNITLGGADRDSSIRTGILLSGYYSDNETDDYPRGLYTTSGFTVSNNTINGYNDWTNYRADDVFADVYTLYTKGAVITGNTLNNNSYGILIQGGGEASNLNSNIFSGEKDASIAVRHGGIVYDMSGNILTHDCPYGIYVDDTASCNGTCEIPWDYIMGAGESLSTRTDEFSLFTNDLSSKVQGTYASSKKSVAKVTKAGKIKGVKKGKATVTASWDRGSGVVNITLTANIKKAPTKVKIAKNKSLKKGSTYQLKPKVNSGSRCSKYTYKSKNKKIASVSKTGLIKAKKRGVTTITVKSYNGVTATITIKVK